LSIKRERQIYSQPVPNPELLLLSTQFHRPNTPVCSLHFKPEVGSHQIRSDQIHNSSMSLPENGNARRRNRTMLTQELGFHRAE